MRVLGFLVLLFGILLMADHFLELDIEFLRWLKELESGAAWGVRGGAVVLGLVMVVAGKKKGGDGK
jgi:hypothetical protein